MGKEGNVQNNFSLNILIYIAGCIKQACHRGSYLQNKTVLLFLIK